MITLLIKIAIDGILSALLKVFGNSIRFTHKISLFVDENLIPTFLFVLFLIFGLRNIPSEPISKHFNIITNYLIILSKNQVLLISDTT